MTTRTLPNSFSMELICELKGIWRWRSTSSTKHLARLRLLNSAYIQGQLHSNFKSHYSTRPQPQPQHLLVIVSSTMSKAPTATADDGELVEPPRLNHVFTLNLTLQDPIVFPSHSGTRAITQLAADKCTLKGPNGIEGKLLLGCDYVNVGVDGSVHLDVHFVWEMENGSKLYQQIKGISLREPNDPTCSVITSGSTFETMDEKYKYLNNAFLFGTGQKKGNEVTVHYYAPAPVQP